ncbi:MAG TPA: hypothetical protein VN681_00215 [Stellaceae bacterium]|nr:hypothetical protein [Stellaceae bacterium]
MLFMMDLPFKVSAGCIIAPVRGLTTTRARTSARCDLRHTCAKFLSFFLAISRLALVKKIQFAQKRKFIGSNEKRPRIYPRPSDRFAFSQRARGAAFFAGGLAAPSLAREFLLDSQQTLPTGLDARRAATDDIPMIVATEYGIERIRNRGWSV